VDCSSRISETSRGEGGFGSTGVKVKPQSKGELIIQIEEYKFKSQSPLVVLQK
jgi:hypothetical protein